MWCNFRSTVVTKNVAFLARNHSFLGDRDGSFGSSLDEAEEEVDNIFYV